MTTYGNPARDAEKFAAAVVQGWVGPTGTVTDRGSTHEPDFRIEYSDGRLGLGEVKTDTEGKIEAMWANAYKSGQAQIVHLPTGLGTWAAQLDAGANIKDLRRDVASLVESLTSLGADSFTVNGSWPEGRLGDSARRLGVQNLFSVPGPADVLYYFMPGVGGSYGGDPNVVTQWIEEVLERFLDKIKNFLIRPADERHVFLVAQSATSFAPLQALTHLDPETLPSRAPLLPDGITHAWAVSHRRLPGAQGFAALWDGLSWSAIPLPLSHDA